VNIAAITEICSTVVTVATLIIGFLAQSRATSKVHDAVNSNLTAQQDRNEQLTRTLTAAGVVVPKSVTDKADD
jgi:hypothetical protein